MKKNIFIIAIFSLLFTGCEEVVELLEEVGELRTVHYTVTVTGVPNPPPSGQTLTLISYTTEFNGDEKLYGLHHPKEKWEQTILMRKGDYVRLRTASELRNGKVTMTIDCSNCEKNGTVSKSYNLSDSSWIGNVQLTLE